MTTNPDQVYHGDSSDENQQPGLAQNSATEHKRHWGSSRRENYTALNNSERILCGISDQSRRIKKEQKIAQSQPFVNICPKMVRHAEDQNSSLYTRPLFGPDEKLIKTLKNRAAAQANRDKKKAYVKSIEGANTQLLQKVKELEAQIELLQYSNSNLWKDLFVVFEEIESEYDDYFNTEYLSPNIGDLVPDYEDIYGRDI